MAQGKTATIRVRGDHFSPRVCSGVWQVDWPTCAGPTVQLRLPGTVGPDGHLHVGNFRWHSLNEVTFDVAVDCQADTSPATRNVFMVNPIEDENYTTAENAFTVLPGAC